MIDPFTVVVPASTSNLGSGFDTVSAALGLHLEARIGLAPDGVAWQWLDPGAGMPDENLIEKALQAACTCLGVPCPGLEIAVRSPIPLRRGLGSSAAAIVAGIKIAEQVAGFDFEPDEALELAGGLEDHPDNLAAALLGGWVLSRRSAQGWRAEKIPSRLQCRFVVAVPDAQVATRDARRILPADYPLEAVTHNLQRCALLVHALHAGREELLSDALADRLHQPYRAKLVPGIEQLLDRQGLDPQLCASVLGVAISGSGSSVVALARDRCRQVGEWMVGVLAEHGTTATVLDLGLDPLGARVSDGTGGKLGP